MYSSDMHIYKRKLAQHTHPPDKFMYKKEYLVVTFWIKCIKIASVKPVFTVIWIHYSYDLTSNLDFTLLPWILVCVNDFILDDVKTWHFLCIIIQVMNVIVVISLGSKTVNLWLWLVCLYSCILFSLCGMSKLPLCS